MRHRVGGASASGVPLLAVHDAARHLAALTPAYDAARGALADAVHTARDQPPGPGRYSKCGRGYAYFPRGIGSLVDLDELGAVRGRTCALPNLPRSVRSSSMWESRYETDEGDPVE